MTAAFFLDDRFGHILLAVICYAGIVLFATGAAIRGVQREVAGSFAVLLFVGLFPLPNASLAVTFAQYVAVVLALAGLGMGQVRFALLRYRAVRAYEAGVAAEPLGWNTALIYLPMLAVAAYAIAAAYAKMMARGLPPTSPFDPVAFQADMAWTISRLFVVVVAFAAYMTAAGLLDRTWLRVVGRIRLLSADARFVWMNSFLGGASLLSTAVIVTRGVQSAAGRYSLLAILVCSLMPAINQLAWIYDAVLRSVVVFHVVLGVAAAIVFAGIPALEAVGLPHWESWALAVTALALAAVMLPGRVDQALERLFPRAGEMRALLMAITVDPLAAATRAEAGAQLLRRVVAVLDAEGGAVAIEATATEPASVHVIGHVEVEPFGATAAAVARSVAGFDTGAPPPTTGIGRGSVPRPIEILPLSEQLRLLDCGIVMVCPLVGRKLEATLLLGPRRGWLYDAATEQALRVFASQAGLALENLALAGARAHAEKLAALGEAAARIAHEIRNPLAAARSLVQLSGQDGANADLVEPALGELDRIGRLVADLLAFARRDEVAAQRQVDLVEVCADALRQTAPLALAAGVAVETDLATAAVLGDRDRLVQVLANLCRNAIEAVADHQPPRRIAVRCAAVDGRAIVEVRDNGPGIATDDLPRLFEPFRTTKSSGTGLGLPIARRLVEAHRGELTVHSAPGQETVFRVALPLRSGA